MIRKINKEPFYCPICGSSLIMAADRYEDFNKNVVAEKVTISCFTCRVKLEKTIEQRFFLSEIYLDECYGTVLLDFFEMSLQRNLKQKLSHPGGDAYE